MTILKGIFIFGIFLFEVLSSSGSNNEFYEPSAKKEELGFVFYNKGIDLGRQGKLDSALFYTKKAIKEFETNLDNDIQLAYSYQGLGIINKLLGKYNDAIGCYSKAEHIYKEKTRYPLLAHIYVNKANIFYIQQDYSKSQDYYLRAIEILEIDSIKYKNPLAHSYNNVANTHQKKQEYSQAILNYFKSLELSKSKNNHVIYGNLANCYQFLDKVDKANQYYQLAIDYAQNSSINGIELAQQQMYYAIFLGKQNNFMKANLYLNQALINFKKNLLDKHPYISECNNAIGELYLKVEQLDSALSYFQKALIALTPEFTDISYNINPNIIKVSSKIHLLNALKNKANVLFLKAKKTSDINYYYSSLDVYSIVIDIFNQIKKGYISIESKFFLLENEFKIFSNALEICFQLYKMTQDPIYLQEAFLFSESVKSTVLDEVIQNSRALNIGSLPDSLILKEKKFEKNIWTYEELIYEESKRSNPNKNQLRFWNKYLFEERQKHAKLLTYLETNYNDYLLLKYKKPTVRLSELQKNISNNETIIEYHLSDSVLYTFLIDKKDLFLYKTKLDSNFFRNLNQIFECLSNNNFSYHGYSDFNQFQNISNELYQVLFGAIRDKILDKNLIIIPDGLLSYLPFEVLTSRNLKFNRINYKELPYLLYQNAISYAYSVNYIFWERTKKRAIKNVATFAPSYNNIDSVFDSEFVIRQQYREKLFPLKGIKTEANIIADLISGDKFIDEKATESNFKKLASDYDILHLAMHTILDDINPMYSKMAFYQKADSFNDGFLNTYELYNTKLNSRLTVLSSCNSGVGRLRRGEGVISLARGFIYAGCPSIVMTLWAVEDNSGLQLMTEFYKELTKGKSKTEALRQSKIEFIKKADQLKSHPYFWSGYVVIGNNKALYMKKIELILMFVLGLSVVGSLLFVLRKKLRIIKK